MVEQLQKKFIISAMLAVPILIVVLIGGINVFNYLTTSNDNDRLMEMLCYSCLLYTSKDKFDRKISESKEKTTT